MIYTMKVMIESSIISLLILTTSIIFSSSAASSSSPSDHPVPTPWPQQFHSILFMNTTEGPLQLNYLYYDYPNGLNLQIMADQLGKEHYAVQWNNGTAYYYTSDEDRECTVRQYPIGILRPDWLDGADYLGQVVKDGFLCNLWEKLDFVWYYEDVVSKRPVYWEFYTGMVEHVMTFEVGVVPDEPKWQAPDYCFDQVINKLEEDRSLPPGVRTSHSFMRAMFPDSMVV